MANPRVRVFVKKKIEVGRLDFSQTQMLKIGTVGLASRKLEISQAKNSQGQSAKPLSRGYAIRKSFLTKLWEGVGRNKRDLRLTGDLMRNFSVRTVSKNQAVIGWSSLKNRQKARENNAREEFISWSPSNTTAVVKVAAIAFAELVENVVLEKVISQ